MRILATPVADPPESNLGDRLGFSLVVPDLVVVPAAFLGYLQDMAGPLVPPLSVETSSADVSSAASSPARALHDRSPSACCCSRVFWWGTHVSIWGAATAAWINDVPRVVYRLTARVPVVRTVGGTETWDPAMHRPIVSNGAIDKQEGPETGSVFAGAWAT